MDPTQEDLDNAEYTAKLNELKKQMAKMNLPSSEQEKIMDKFRTEFGHKKKMQASDYNVMKIVGRGAFGEVRVCSLKNDKSGKILAMKVMKKDEMIKKNQVAHIRAERDVLAQSENPWIVKLFHSFQDSKNLCTSLCVCIDLHSLNITLVSIHHCS